jgi:ABC-type lipoprotein release transport system permease subunit
VPWELDAEPRWLTIVGLVRDMKGWLACSMPARRAARLDPAVTLRASP